MAKDNKYAKVEGLLYSYKTLPYTVKGLELRYQETNDNEVRERLDSSRLSLDKVSNMLELLKQGDETDYQIIKLKYIDKLTWGQIEARLHMTKEYMIRRRNNVINNNLIALV